MSIFIKNILHCNKRINIYIEGNKITEVGGPAVEADYKIDGTNKAIIPGMVNCHTHAAMTLFRSYADDLELFDWLQNKIWPLEAKLTQEDVYWGTKLACLEMIKSGTTCFNDMYWHLPGALKAVEDMGMRAVLSDVFIDMHDPKKAQQQMKHNKQEIAELNKKIISRIKLALGPHALYTVSEESLRWIADYAKENDMLVHFHLCETEKEVKDCVKKYGKKPVPYLNSLGFLHAKLIAAHCVWMDDKDIALLAQNDVKVSYDPVSNMKLSVGGALPYPPMIKKGLQIGLGTDGTASNNNLDMFETMKFASLLQKFMYKSQTLLPANDVFNMATTIGANILGWQYGIKEGCVADLALIDLKRPEFTPHHNLISNLVYSAHGSCVDTTIVDGKPLMLQRKVEGEEELLEKVEEVAMELVEK